jgi:hypothetical protein
MLLVSVNNVGCTVTAAELARQQNKIAYDVFDISGGARRAILCLRIVGRKALGTDSFCLFTGPAIVGLTQPHNRYVGPRGG